MADALYGYADDEVKISPFVFGLNNKCFLEKFEWIHNAGKDGAEAEAIDIVFNINGTKKSYRMFPFVAAYDNNVKITDPTNPEFVKQLRDYKARITHILHCFADKEVVKTRLSSPDIQSFKQYAEICRGIIGANGNPTTVELQIFLQYQWNASEGQSKTYLDIPKSMKYGKWITRALPGTWTEVIVPNAPDKEPKALSYVNENGVEHPFVRNGWYMASNFANQQKPTNSAAATAMNNLQPAGVPQPALQPAPAATTGGWGEQTPTAAQPQEQPQQATPTPPQRPAW